MIWLLVLCSFRSWQRRTFSQAGPIKRTMRTLPSHFIYKKLSSKLLPFKKENDGMSPFCKRCKEHHNEKRTPIVAAIRKRESNHQNLPFFQNHDNNHDGLETASSFCHTIIGEMDVTIWCHSLGPSRRPHHGSLDGSQSGTPKPRCPYRVASFATQVAFLNQKDCR